MGFLIIPALLILTISPGSGENERELADFSRFSHAVNREIAIIDQDGVVREGTVTMATADAVTVRFGSGEKAFSRADIVSAERMRDGRIDGAVKGAVFGTVLGLLTMQAYDGNERAGALFGSMAIYSGIGYALDAAQTHREPIYRTPGAPSPAPKPALSLSFRF